MNLLERLREAPKAIPRPPKAAIIAVLVVLGVGVVIFGAGAAIQFTHRDRILPNVSYAGIDLSGMDRVTAIESIQTALDALREQGLVVVVNDQSQSIPLQELSAEVTIDYVDLDVNTAVDAAFAKGSEKNAWGFLQATWLGTFGSVRMPATLSFNQEALQAAMLAAYPDVEDPGQPTDFIVSFNGGDVTDVQVSEPIDGQGFDFETAFYTLQRDAEDLTLTKLELPIIVVYQPVSVAEARTLLGNVYAALRTAPYTLTYSPENTDEPLTWEVTAEQLSDWLLPVVNNGEVVLSVNQGDMTTLFTELHEAIDVQAENARFAMENNWVSEFAPSQNGVTVNEDATIAELAETFGSEETDVLVAVDIVEAEITTGNVNNLGITEKLGTGTSTYGGSPSNRIANIKHGLSKLNGLLIAPGETVSLLEKLRPFTIADGYLPELVIKGDEIKPEVGGGLCQIGSTTFRAVMNAGLKVVERRNHSLVVSYYNDLSNGNPGTDATIYDPSPDFKFMNDTQNYILLTTEMDDTDKMLYFTFWGTSDGRQGSYEPPQVLTWSGYGATQYKETDSLAPGVTQCQSPHPGATTTFTYTVEYADGTKHEEEFFSSYRSLPKICLVGKEDAAEEAPSEDTDSTEDATEDTTNGSSEEPIAIE